MDHGALPDSLTVNPLPIQNAIDECSRNGGGVVLIPQGNFVSGTILIKDNVNLKLETGAVLLGSTDITDYRMLDPFLTVNSAPLG